MTPEQAAARLKRFGDRNTTALALARRLSFAALVEPALVRRVRLDLVPGASAADEADLWFSDLVQSRSPGGFMFFPEVAELLRNGLAPEPAAQAWTVTREMHAHLRRAIRVEEELTYLGTAPGTNQTRIQDLLGTVVSALIGGTPGLANWAGRALPRLPAAVQNTEPAAALRIASDLRLGRASDFRGILGRAAEMPSWISVVLPSLPRVRLEVSLSSREIVLGPAISDPTAVVAYSIEVPDTPTIPVEVKWTSPSGPRSKILFVEKGATSQPERIDPGPIELVTLANEKWTLAPFAVGTARKMARPSTLAAYSDGYAVTLHWRSHGKIPHCLGYAVVRRQRNPSTLEADTEQVLDSRIGFANQPGAATPSSRHPVQRSHWIDRPARGAAYSYRVIPVFGSPTAPAPAQELASAWTPWIWVGLQPESDIAVSFNRTTEAAASLDLSPSDLQEISEHGFLPTIQKPHNPVREALGGDLLLSVLNLLEEAASSLWPVYAAIFELDDPQIIQLLAGMNKLANVVLSNGAASKAKPDSNLDARQQLKKAGVNVHDRILRAGKLAHNKFLILCDTSGQPHTVWTGNVSWATSSLCARSNAGVIVRSGQLAAAYLSYWRQLASGSSQALSQWTAQAQPPVQVGPATVKPWFTPNRNLADIREATEYIKRARQGVLFLLSEPGREASVLTAILDQKNLFLLGVTRNGPTLTLYRNGTRSPISRQGSALPLLASLKMSKRPSLPLGAPLQTRLIVVDPLGTQPVVLVGSHGFGARGSRTNDENFLVIENDPETARRSAAHIDAYCRQYAFRALAGEKAPLEAALRPDDSWQDSLLEPAEQAEVAFWMGDDARAFSVSKPIALSAASSAGALPQTKSARSAPRKARSIPAAAKKPAKTTAKAASKRPLKQKRRLAKKKK